VAHPSHPSQASPRQAKLVQFVSLAHLGSGWGWEGVCLPNPSGRFPQLPSTSQMGRCLFAWTAAGALATATSASKSHCSINEQPQIDKFKFKINTTSVPLH